MMMISVKPVRQPWAWLDGSPFADDAPVPVPAFGGIRVTGHDSSAWTESSASCVTSYGYGLVEGMDNDRDNGGNEDFV